MMDFELQTPAGGLNGGRDYYIDFDPPMSRLFIVCNKSHNEDDFRMAFSPFGEIKDIWIVKDKFTHENKGIAYIKFGKISEAAKAQEEMNGKAIGNISGSIKVLFAANRNQGSSRSDIEHEKFVRLFILCSKNAIEQELHEEFSKYGDVESITIVKDKTTGISKGCGYIRYTKFSHAAFAYENCPHKYKAIFAEPRGSTRTQRDHYGRANDDISGLKDFNSNMQRSSAYQPTCLEVTVSNLVNQDQLWRLFDIIPGLESCQFTKEIRPKSFEAKVVYENAEAAAYAKEKLHGLEYPLGERIIIKLAGLQYASMETSFIDKSVNNESIVNVLLPPMQSMASPNEPMAQRLFIVLAGSVPLSILKNVFSCWKGLINIYMLPNKNCGYVKYADKDSAQQAIQVLHGAEICGVKLKVLEAEERNYGDEAHRKRLRSN
ncbi:RNA-binding protein 45-like isoform X2 [Teleopsis dalmanni]|uniref:RNA-binding protein 45-like n=1 Tax=Teleopsis dalmanni TaxID=139649 RepID=UPI0018CF55EA|nr:RNA-binding protein 45-like [Teleopsis dalmanni]XP_037940387.1 RNA-binding protein 45-like isoform X1 [Teleopsis dalmanni]XP_037940388.1 RNA-binding protein 45-like isoform X1 [Teleopsis dalmanni]XP_037940389.1 RNA-binding protein 45-like isoform X2 [Teleopsis dalmanni]